ncbi:21522_t:CDS:2, partial [Gigaspora rosea]
PNFTTRAIYIRIITKIEKRETSLREHWSIVLSQKKTYMVTPGRFDIAELEKRNNYRGIIRNISTRATDSLLLHQLKKYKVQAVQILNNSNGNRARRAYIYFSSEQDKKAAQDTTNHSDLNNNKKNHIHTYREPFKRLENISKSNHEVNRIATGANREELGRKRGKQ